MKNYSIINTLLYTVLLHYQLIFSQSDTLMPPPVDSVSGNSEQHNEQTTPLKNAIKDTAGIVPETSINTSANEQDSLLKIKRRNFFLSANTFFLQRNNKFPESIDSLFNPTQIYPFQIYQADGMDIYDILYAHTSFIPVPLALSSNLNRYLYYGFPANHSALHPNFSNLPLNSGQDVGQNVYSAAEIKNVTITPPGDIAFNTQPFELSKPEMGILWENGVFNENLLNIRFARPLANNLYVGLFSNYRFLNRQEFNHKTGGMYGFFLPIYESLGKDSTYVSYKGTNPLTSEQVTTLRLHWKAKNGTVSGLSYKYADLHNDLATAYFSDTITMTQSFAWDKRSHYGHTVCGNITALPLGDKGSVHTEGYLQRSLNRISAVSSTINTHPLQRGEELIAGGTIKPSFRYGNGDSLGIEFTLLRDETIRNDVSKWVMHYTRPRLFIIHNYTYKTLPITGTLEANIGQTFVKLNDKLEHILTWETQWSQALGKQHLRLYAKQDILPPDIPYDTTFTLLPGQFADKYQSYGTEGLLQYHKIGIKSGICFMQGVKPSSVAMAWPDGIPPYAEPTWTVSVTPIFGQWHGLSLFSQWLFSDTKPYIKSKSLLSWHHNREGNSRHLFLDVGFDYWSERDSINYAGIDIWHRPILDLHCKTTIQIHSFRLFYKIDNMFNRNIAYVPGYYMPGLVFRWGFNWLIQG